MKFQACFIAFTILPVLASPATASTLYRCTDSLGHSTYTNYRARAKDRDCVDFKKEDSKFRMHLKPGDIASDGLVIEVKPPLARIQTDRGERWFRIDDISPTSRHK